MPHLKLDTEVLRREMISAFHEFSATPSFKIILRDKAWAYYCEKREHFLEQDCIRRGKKYITLHDTMIFSQDYLKSN